MKLQRMAPVARVPCMTSKPPTRGLPSVVAALLVLLIAAPAALACDCTARTTAEQAAAAGLVFRGVVTEVRGDPQDGGAEYVFAPARVWKGAAGFQYVVASPLPSAMCGAASYDVGTDLMVFAWRSGDGSRWETNGCSGTGSADRVLDDVVAALGPGKVLPTSAPTTSNPTVFPEIEVHPSDQPTPWPAWAAGLIVLGIAAVIVVTFLLIRSR